MSNLLDYLDWRGDLTFGNAPLCPVDSLLLSAISYAALDRVLAADPKAEPQRLSALAEQLSALELKSKNEEERLLGARAFREGLAALENREIDT